MSPRVRIQGLVRLAHDVRRQLSGPLTPGRREHLREVVAAALADVRRVCGKHGARPDDLPTPSRKAYRFLAGIDWDHVQADERAAAAKVPGTVYFTGLQSDLRRIMERLARPAEEPDEEAYERIRALSERVEGDLRRDGLPPERLTDPTRRARGWLALFAQRSYFELYVGAVALAEPVLRRAVERGAGPLRPPVRVWFQPMKPPAKVRGDRDGALFQCRTPMVGFDQRDFAVLADVMVHRRRNGRALHDAVLGGAYRDLDAELGALGGVVERTAGAHHDLAAAFERVNRRYFDRALEPPVLTWSRTLTHRKFGHYDHVHDTVMVSATLDQPHVPAFVVDFLIYHELLHKHHGIRWRNGRAYAHTPAFRADERRFEHYHEAERVLGQLARE